MLSPAQSLARTLWLRQPGKRYRFQLRAAAEPALLMERVGQKSPRSELTTGGAAADAISGAVLVDPEFRLVFCAPNDPPALLMRLASWARQASPDLPAVATLIGAGAAEADFDWTSDAAVEAIDPASLTVYRNSKVWAGLVSADAASVADVLAGCQPGERLWYWLCGAPGLPLLLQPVSKDPNRDRLNALIDIVEQGGPAAAATGVGYVADDGSLQLIGPTLHAGLLPPVAEWVRRHGAQYPSLARLAGTRLLRSVRGRVAEVIDLPALWDGVPRPVPPGTTAETASLFAAMQPGAEYWFWLTGAAPRGAFMSLASMSDDPEGTGFIARMDRLYRRFPGSYADAVSGIVRRLDSGALVFATAQAQLDHWPALRQRLADAYGAAEPGLARAELLLGGSRLTAV